MKKLILATALLAIAAVPVTANAAQCRNSATGKFAKCGTLGSVPASQYVAKGKSKAKGKMAKGMMAKGMMGSPKMAAMPMATPAAKHGMFSKMKAKMAKPAAAPAAH